MSSLKIFTIGYGRGGSGQGGSLGYDSCQGNSLGYGSGQGYCSYGTGTG